MYLKTAFGICFLVIYIAFLGEALCKKEVVQQQNGQLKRMAHLGKRRIQYNKRQILPPLPLPGLPTGLRQKDKYNKRQTALPTLPQLPALQLPTLAIPQLPAVGGPPPAAAAPPPPPPPPPPPAAPAPPPAAADGGAAPVDPYAASYYPPPPPPPPAGGGKKDDDEEEEEEEGGED